MGTWEKCLERQGEFVTSDNEEHFNCSGYFDTKQGAIAHGRSEGHLYVGRIDVPNPATGVDEDSLLEQITCDDRYAGDHWDGYLQSNHATDKQFAELQESLKSSLISWLDKHELWPDCSNVVDIEPIPELGEGGDV